MNKVYYKKSIGTLVFAVLILGVALVGFSVVRAQFINNPNDKLHFDGIVSQIGPSPFHLTLVTSGTEPVTVHASVATNFTGGLEWRHIDVGDHLKVIADLENGRLEAKLIKKIEGGSGYGTAGDVVKIAPSELISKTSNTFTIDSGAADSGAAVITFYVDASTKFIGSSFANLNPGDVIQVKGVDSGTNFLARRVILRKKKINTGLDR